MWLLANRNIRVFSRKLVPDVCGRNTTAQGLCAPRIVYVCMCVHVYRVSRVPCVFLWSGACIMRIFFHVFLVRGRVQSCLHFAHRRVHLVRPGWWWIYGRPPVLSALTKERWVASYLEVYLLCVTLSTCFNCFVRVDEKSWVALCSVLLFCLALYPCSLRTRVSDVSLLRTCIFAAPPPPRARERGWQRICRA